MSHSVGQKDLRKPKTFTYPKLVRIEEKQFQAACFCVPLAEVTPAATERLRGPSGVPSLHPLLLMQMSPPNSHAIDGLAGLCVWFTGLVFEICSISDMC